MPSFAPPAGSQTVGELYVVRHGETEWSRTGRHTSCTDLPLTEDGRARADRLRAALAGHSFAQVVVSPRRRAVETAELAGLTGYTVDPDAAEWAYGDYEGRTTPEIRADRPGWTIWTGDPPGGESAGAVGARADRLLGRLRAGLSGGDAIVVGHGHFGRVLAARYLELPATDGRLLVLDPATLCVLGAERDSPVIRKWNQTV